MVKGAIRLFGQPLLFFTYFCRITFRKVIIEKTKDILNIKMDNKRAAEQKKKASFFRGH